MINHDKSIYKKFFTLTGDFFLSLSLFFFSLSSRYHQKLNEYINDKNDKTDII